MRGFFNRYKYYAKNPINPMLSDKKAAKKIIKIAKSDPNFYSREDVIYAKIYKKSLKNGKQLPKDKTK